MIQLIEEEKPNGVFSYLDNITICGLTEKDHDNNLRLFLKQLNGVLVFNDSKTILTTRKLPILGFEVEEREIRPDHKRLTPLCQMPIPNNMKSLNRAIAFFSYYSKWISHFSNKIKPLT